MTPVAHHVPNLSLRAEAETLLCCARLHLDEATLARLKSAVDDESFDWAYLIRLAKRHALLPLLYKNLSAHCPSSVPEIYLNGMQSYIRQHSARNLLLTEELCRILKLFAAHNIKAVPYKGPLLSSQLYGNIFLRRFTDLDILIDRRDVNEAKELLLSQGYRDQYQLTSVQQAAFIESSCEYVFVSADDRLTIEVHWKFVPRYFSLALAPEPMWPRLRRVPFNQLEVLSFAPEDLLLILCVNAGKDLWSKLGSLCDISELVKAHGDLNWEFVLEEAEKAGIRRLLLLGLSLAHRLLQTPLPEFISAKVEADSAIRALAIEVRERLFREDVAPRSFFQTARFLLRSRERRLDRIRFCNRLLRTPTPGDWAFVSLPDNLFFLYHLVRPLRILKAHRSSETKINF